MIEIHTHKLFAILACKLNSEIWLISETFSYFSMRLLPHTLKIACNKCKLANATGGGVHINARRAQLN